MFDLQKLVRKNIAGMKPYSSARSEYAAGDGVFLDANENPFGNLNRYPDPYQRQLRQRLGNLKGVPAGNIFIGNGSDEVIDLIIRIFCRPEVDKILSFSPTYGMYEVAAETNDIALLEIPLDQYFQIDKSSLDIPLKDDHLKVIFICSPNNPTGNCIDDIEMVLQDFDGIVVVDEAYIDFAQRPSFIGKLSIYPNLIVTQTLSKAWGLASARIGIAYAQEGIIHLLNRVKPPYNVSGLNQEAALQALKNQPLFEANKGVLLQQKAWMEEQMNRLPIVEKVYPSDANFLLVKTTDANRIYKELLLRNIITRNRDYAVPNCIRITIGSPEENRRLIMAMQQIQP